MVKLFPILFAITLITSGCASLNSDFNCPAGTGVGCKSIHEVNQMVDEGKLAAKRSSSAAKIKTAKQSSLQSSTNVKAPKRTNEKVLSIWIAPYEDASGNYHDASTVHTVVKSSTWASTNNKGGN